MELLIGDEVHVLWIHGSSWQQVPTCYYVAEELDLRSGFKYVLDVSRNFNIVIF